MKNNIKNKKYKITIVNTVIFGQKCSLYREGLSLFKLNFVVSFSKKICPKTL